MAISLLHFFVIKFPGFMAPLLLSRFCDHLMSDASQNKLLKWSFAYLFKKNGDDAASYRLGLPKICVLLRLCGLL